MKTTLYFFLIAGPLLFSYPLQAQELKDTVPSAESKEVSIQGGELKEAVVIGQYSPNSREKSIHKIDIITRKQIDALGAQNLTDALQYQPNIRIQQDNILGAGLSIQGVGGENVKILIDGVPVIGRQNGQLDLSQILLTDVERIEIVEGPLSVQYGTNALAGAINIVRKKKPDAPVEGKINTYYESDGHYNVDASAGLRSGAHSLLLTGGRDFFQGWSPVDTSRNQLWKPKETYFGSWAYNFHQNDWDFAYRGDFFHELTLDRGIPAAPYGEYAFDDYYRTTRLSNLVQFSKNWNESVHSELLASYNIYKHIRNIYRKDLTTLQNVLTENSGDQDTTRFDAINVRARTYSAQSGPWNYEAGVDINVQKGAGDRIDAASRVIGDYAVFASSEWRPSDNLAVRPGLRYAYNTAYPAPLIPSLNVRWKWSDDYTLRASYAKGFRSPELKELYLLFEDVNHNIQGNPNLSAERSNNFNANLGYHKNYERAALKIDGGVYFNQIDNLITLAKDASKDQAGKPPFYEYVNINSVETYGFQASAEYTLQDITLSPGFIFNQKRNQFDQRDYLAPSSEIKLNFSYRWRNIGSFNLFYRYLSAQPDYAIDENKVVSPTSIAAYSLADVSYSKKFLKNKVSLTTGIKNIFDVKNIFAQGGGGVHTIDTGATSVGTGRNFFLKLTLGFASL